MDIPLNEVLYFDAITSSPTTGAASDADSTPTFAVYEEATDSDIGVGGNLTKRTGLTGNYRGTFTISAANGFEVGKWYAVIVSATVNGVAGKAVAKTFRVTVAEGVAGGDSSGGSGLISSARALYNIGAALGSANPSLNAAETTTIDALILACSAAIRKYCGRYFNSATYDELYNGDDQERLVLKELPIISVSRVAYDPVGILRIKNTSSANDRATVAVTSTGLVLTRVASGTVTTDSTVLFATYTTLSAVASAVNALGNGWSAEVLDSDYSTRASADLLAVQGALSCSVYFGIQADLKIHLNELSDYTVQTSKGWLRMEGCRWYGGVDFWRIIYTAGYATIPEDIQEACASWVCLLFYQTKHDPLTVNVIADAEGTGYVPLAGKIPDRVKALIEPYRKRSVGLSRG